MLAFPSTQYSWDLNLKSIKIHYISKLQEIYALNASLSVISVTFNNSFLAHFVSICVIVIWSLQVIVFRGIINRLDTALHF